jgi:hypothetical protein
MRNGLTLFLVSAVTVFDTCDTGGAAPASFSSASV